MSGAGMSTLATPLRPVFETSVNGGGTNNASPTSAYLGFTRSSPIAFGPDTPLGNLHAGMTCRRSSMPARISST